jgi:hypothetical protein
MSVFVIESSESMASMVSSIFLWAGQTVGRVYNSLSWKNLPRKENAKKIDLTPGGDPRRKSKCSLYSRRNLR